MKLVAPTVAFAVRTVKGERRRIRSFLRHIETLGVDAEDLPAAAVKTLHEAELLLGRYLDIFGKETPTEEQLRGVMEDLGGIDRVVRSAMSDILKAMGWRPEKGKDPRGELPSWDEEANGPGPDRPSAGKTPEPSAGQIAGPSAAQKAGPAATRSARRAAGQTDGPSAGPPAKPLAPGKGGKVIPFPGPGERGRKP